MSNVKENNTQTQFENKTFHSTTCKFEFFSLRMKCLNCLVNG